MAFRFFISYYQRRLPGLTASITHLLTAPQDGGEWNADNLPLKVELMNRGTVE